MKNGVGELRRSKLVTTFGPGAILDLRAGNGAPLSGVLAGLEEWDRCAPPGHHGLGHDQVVNEPRLQKRLNVGGFRLPPVKEEREKRFGFASETSTDVLPVVRFPEWLVCPSCNRLNQARNWSKAPGRPERWCESHDDRVDVFPVRFIVACEDGHLDEFPWKAWARCRCEAPKLYLDTRGPGLAGKVVRCASCKHERSLEGCFGKDALRTVGITRCDGRQPWLGGRAAADPHDDRIPRVLQRGASNVYYSSIRSSLDIPPFSSDLSPVFGRYWTELQEADPAEWPNIIRFLKMSERTGRPAQVLLQMLAEWKAALDADSTDQPLEWAEYIQFRESGVREVSQKEFQTEPGEVPAELGEVTTSVVLASRLREVRAIDGFTRINPPGRESSGKSPKRARIYIQRLDWLPAVELRGEGIFLRFDEERVQRWERLPAVQARVEKLRTSLATLLPAPEASAALTARAAMLHSLAHALIRRLSLDCGYSSSALRERLYVGEPPRAMCGILLHTGAPDAEGTLGGLVRQGTPDRLWETFRGALHEMSWCSSDPVCITGTVTLSSPENLAACHACLLVPETSCQWFNRVLDRALLIGLPDDPQVGFFRDVLRQSVL